VTPRTSVVLIVAVAASASLLAEPQRQAGEASCAASQSARGPARDSHAYFDALIARPECILAYSLRDPAQLKQFTHSRRKPQAVFYDPAADTDPRRQDAAKLVVPSGKVSLPNQVRLPMNTADGTTTLVTWDAWFGAEFAHEHTRIATYKTFQFASPKERIWFEVRTRFKQDDEKPAAGKPAAGTRRERKAAAGKNAAAAKPDAAVKTPPAQAAKPEAAAAAAGGGGRGRHIGMVDARAYGGGGATPMGPNVTKAVPLAPQAGNFAVRAETWTRYWVSIEQRADDWDLVSLWVADEGHDPVLVIDRLQLSVKRGVEEFWLEYNTSSKGRAEGLGSRVGYARNVVILRNVKDLPNLLKRPVK
jgi:hypothetical protein